VDISKPSVSHVLLLNQDLHSLLLPPVLDFSIKYSVGIQEEAEAKYTTAQPSDKEDAEFLAKS